MSKKKFTTENEYDVGYGKPPAQHRFKKGNKEYLKRKKERKREGLLFRDLAAAPVKILRKGRAFHVSRLQLLIDNYVAAAARGDINAAAYLLRIHSTSKELGNLLPELLQIQMIIVDPKPREENGQA